MKIKTKILLSGMGLVFAAMLALAIINSSLLTISAKELGDQGKEFSKNVTKEFLERGLDVGEINDQIADLGLQLIVAPARIQDSGDFVRDASRNIIPAVLGMIVIATVLSYFFTLQLSKKITVPLDKLTEAAQRIQNGELSTKVEYKHDDEFGKVCDAFNKMQESLAISQEKNKAYEIARTEMVVGISHDIRTPLTSVKGYIKGIRDGVANSEEKREQYLEIAYRKACDMDILLQRLFHFSQVELGVIPCEKEEIDVNEFFGDISRESAAELKHIGAEFEMELPKDRVRAWFDVKLMHRVFQNLIENSIKYANKDDLKIKVSVSVENTATELKIVYRDNGEGVREEHITKLFDRFWRADSARATQNGQGSGLGLYLVSEMINAHGGTIKAHNDNGLVFTIIIPRGEGV